MAKNIIITPAPGGNPNIDFQGATSGTIKLEVRDDGSLLVVGATETDIISLYDETANPVRVPSISLEDSNATHHLKIVAGSNLSANRTFTLTTGDAARTLDISAADVTISSFGATVLDDADASAVRTTLGLVIGTNVQAYDADLATWAGLTPSAYFQTLVDDTDASTARGTLGLGTSATVNTGTSGTTIPLLDGTNTWANVQTLTSTPVLSANLTIGNSVASYIGGGTNNAFIIDPSFGIGGRTTASVEFLIDSNNDDTTRVFRVRTNSSTLGSSGTVLFSVAEDGTIESSGNTIWHAGNDGSGSGLDADTLRATTPSAFGLTLIDDADASASRTTLGLGTSATVNTGTSGTVIPLLDGNNTWSGTANIFQFANLMWASNNTDDTNKSLRLLSRNYDTSVESEGWTALAADITTSTHVISIGGVDASYNAATQLDFYTAANVSTRTGTLRMRITSAGVIQDGSGNKVWTAGNDGASSGLDADLIQGVTPTAFGLSLIDDAAASNARTTLGLVIGTNVAASCANTDLTSVYLNNTGLKIKDTNASHGLTIAPGSDLSADRTLTITTGDAARTLDISGGSVTISAFGATLTDDADASTARTTLGLAIGTNVQAYHASLASIAGLTTLADKGIYTTASNTYATYDLTSVARTLLAQTSQANMRTTGLGLGTSATVATGTSGATIPLLNGANTWSTTQTFTVAPVFTDASGSRTALGLAIGTNVQAYDADLTTWAGLTPSAFFQTLVDDANAAAVYTTLTLVGPDQLWVPASYMKVRTSNGCATLATTETTTNKVNIETLDFDASTAEYAQFTIRLPKRYATSTFTAKFNWKHASTSTNFTVIWGIQAGAFGDGETLDTAFGTAQTVSDTGGNTSYNYTSSATGAVTIANVTAEELVYFQVYRDATNGSDNLAIDAGLIGVLLQFTTTNPTDT